MEGTAKLFEGKILSIHLLAIKRHQGSIILEVHFQLLSEKRSQPMIASLELGAAFFDNEPDGIIFEADRFLPQRVAGRPFDSVVKESEHGKEERKT